MHILLPPLILYISILLFKYFTWLVSLSTAMAESRELAGAPASLKMLNYKSALSCLFHL